MTLFFFIASAALAAAATIGAAYSEVTSSAPAKAVPDAPASAVLAAVAPTTSSASSVLAVAQSPETERLEQRRILYETVDSLLQASEFERARKLLDEEQQRHGDDVAPEWRDLEQGYRVMADCLERPSPKHRARGEAFLLVNEATALNAKLRAACAAK